MSGAGKIEQAAAVWLMRRQEPGWTAADQAELEGWLDESFAHAAAFWRLEHGYGQLDRLVILGDHAATPPAEVELPAPALADGSPVASRPVWWRSLPVLPAVAAMLLVAVLSAGLFLTSAPEPRAHTVSLATRVGQVSKLALEDGSQISLNTDTGIAVRQTKGRRELWLDRGEIYMEVVHDEARPFVIHAGQATITDLGTRFVIRKSGGKVSVAVLEGIVSFGPARRPGAGANLLAAGEKAITDGSTTVVSQESVAAIERSLAWQEGMVVFSNTPLAEAAAQFNRYNARQLVISGATAQNMRVEGTFSLANVDGFARLLHQAYGLRLVDRGETLVVSAN